MDLVIIFDIQISSWRHQFANQVFERMVMFKCQKMAKTEKKHHRLSWKTDEFNQTDPCLQRVPIKEQCVLIILRCKTDELMMNNTTCLLHVKERLFSPVRQSTQIFIWRPDLSTIDFNQHFYRLALFAQDNFRRRLSSFKLHNGYALYHLTCHLY